MKFLFESFWGVNIEQLIALSIFSLIFLMEFLNWPFNKMMTQYYLKITFSIANFYTSGFYFTRERNWYKLQNPGLSQTCILRAIKTYEHF